MIRIAQVGFEKLSQIFPPREEREKENVFFRVSIFRVLFRVGVFFCSRFFFFFVVDNKQTHNARVILLPLNKERTE